MPAFEQPFNGHLFGGVLVFSAGPIILVIIFGVVVLVSFFDDFCAAALPACRASSTGSFWRIAALRTVLLLHRTILYGSVRCSPAPCTASEHESRPLFLLGIYSNSTKAESL